MAEFPSSHSHYKVANFLLIPAPNFWRENLVGPAELSCSPSISCITKEADKSSRAQQPGPFPGHRADVWEKGQFTGKEKVTDARDKSITLSTALAILSSEIPITSHSCNTLKFLLKVYWFSSIIIFNIFSVILDME